MAIKEIPTGGLPYEVVDKLPKTGEENKIYGVPIDPEDELTFYTDYRWHNNAWEQVNLGDTIPGFLFDDYQESVQETVSAMEETIAEQGAIIEAQTAAIAELEEAVFPVEQTSFEMMMTSLIDTELDLYDENDELIPNQGLSVEYSDNPYELVYQNEVKKGTYYLKNADGYALGKPDGTLQPLVCEGGTANLGNVEIVMSIEGGGDSMEDGGDL